MSIPITAKLITALATMAFLVYCATVILLTLRIIHNSGWSKGAVLVALVFLSSPFVVMSAHLNGYYDNIIIMLGVFSVALLLNGKLWLAACLQVLAVLAHENAMILVFPFFLFGFITDKSQAARTGNSFFTLCAIIPAHSCIHYCDSQSIEPHGTGYCRVFRCASFAIFIHPGERLSGAGFDIQIAWRLLRVAKPEIPHAPDLHRHVWADPALCAGHPLLYDERLPNSWCSSRREFRKSVISVI